MTEDDMSNCNLFLKFTTTDPKQSIHLSGYTLSTCVHEIDVCNLLLFIRSCSSDEESKVMSRRHAHQNDMRGTLRGAIASCIFACCIALPLVYAHAPDDDAP